MTPELAAAYRESARPFYEGGGAITEEEALAHYRASADGQRGLIGALTHQAALAAVAISAATPAGGS